METIVPRGRLTGPILPRFVLEMKMSTDAKMLYALLCDFAADKDHYWPSQARLAGLLSCSISSIKKYLRELVEQNLIAIRRNSFHSSTYFLLKPSSLTSRNHLSLRPQEPRICLPPGKFWL